MTTVSILDKSFTLYLTQEQIENAIYDVAKKISTDYTDKNPLFVVVLNGAFMFAAQLLKDVTIPCQVNCVKLSSYEGTTTTGTVKETIGLTTDVRGRHVVIVEDIVDTGTTMLQITKQLQDKGAASIEICSMLHKPAALLYKEMKPKYIGIEIPNDFIVGYGLDYYEYGRNLKDIYVVE